MTRHPINIFLRPIVKADITDRYLSWFQDGEVINFLEARDLTRDKVIAYIESGITSRTFYMYALCLRDGGLHIGNVKIGPFNRRNNVTDLVTIIGDRDYWGKGIGQIAIEMGTSLGFEDGGIRKFFGSIDSLNQGSLKAYKRAGWHVETVAKGFFQHKIDGEYVLSDRVFVGCDNPNFDNDQAQDWHPILELGKV